MGDAKIAIIGAGLSGLVAAWQLDQQGRTDWQLFEARDRIGGRILSPEVLSPTQEHSQVQPANRLDLGPSWFWPEFQPQLAQLVQALGLQAYPQYAIGDLLLERSSTAPAQRFPNTPQVPESMRLLGGMAALTEALQARIGPDRLQLRTPISRLTLDSRHAKIRLEALDARGASAVIAEVDQVLLAIPPRLIADTLQFQPALAPALQATWHQTETWMAPHAKYFAVYAEPFWRAQGLSGEARSAVGPLNEIHDASIPDGPAALFGFFALPAATRAAMSESELRTLCRAQLARLFGAKAQSPLQEFYQDWAQEPFTATSTDRSASGEHPNPAPMTVDTGLWQHRLLALASECSPSTPGYLAGAVEAALLAVQSALS